MISAFDSFLANNKSIEKKIDKSFHELSHLWSDDTFVCRLPKTTNFSKLKDIILPKELSAIYNRDIKELEFIFSPLKPNESFLSRTTKFFYKNIEFQTEFSAPSEALEIIAKGFIEIDINSETNYRNLRFFRDFYKQENLTDFGKHFYKGKQPFSFKVNGDFDKINNDFVGFSKHINVYSRFFDRKSPVILIFENQVEKTKYELPCLTKNTEFPSNILMREIDPVLIDLFHIANETSNIRLKYIFYYQILEYCAYYHLNDDLRRNLNNILKNPDLISNYNNYSRLIIEEFKNNFKNNDDKLKLEKLVIDFCSYDDIKLEISCNPNSFIVDIEFDGGFLLNSILKDENDIENPPKDIMKKIVDRIDRIRNVLVHIRESRENKIILPTKKNNNQLFAYVYLLRRIAERVAFKFEN